MSKTYVNSGVVEHEVFAESIPGPLNNGLDMSNGLENNSNGVYGRHPAIQLINAHSIQIEHRGKFKMNWFCCDQCNGDLARKYFYVLENGIERNHPHAFDCFCFQLPPNCCCPGYDSITKFYFDRAIFNMQDCHWKSGCLNGAPTVFSGERQRVCCFMNCCVCYNQWMDCYIPYICGEAVRVVPFERSCFCCPTRANCCYNCCGCWGLKTGEPMLAYTLVGNLIDGESVKVAYAINSSRYRWCQRNNVK